MRKVESRCTEPPVDGGFEAFYRQEYPAVVALVYGLSGGPAVAEDLAQEAFLRAHADWPRIERMERPAAWVRRVAINLVMSRFRRLRSEVTATRRLAASSPRWVPPISVEHAAFWNEVRRLPRRQAQAVALRYIDELSVAEIAEVLQVAKGTVKALLHQGRTRLARQLAAKGWIDDEV
jgi:RNA polymerase sigma-70 factor (ECF subfamily)